MKKVLSAIIFVFLISSCGSLISLETRPWGTYEILLEEKTYKVKRIVVFPGKRLSLQRHKHRAEHWVIVEGTGLATLGDKQIAVSSGAIVNVAQNEIHRIENNGVMNLEFIEVQTGSYFGEDDIERLADDYGRKLISAIPLEKDNDVAVLSASSGEEWLEQKQFFEENGYLWIKDFFSPEQVKLFQFWADDINTASQSILTHTQMAGQPSQNIPEALIVVPEAADPYQACRAEDMLSCYQDLHQFIEGTVTSYIGGLLGELYVPFKDKINFKWPGGGAFSPHQDFPAYELFGPGEHVTAMVCIDRATFENGCLQVAQNWKDISEEL
jgi:mannose-6-phosphate isomerase-like protein (cupin superfamily)